MLVAAAVCPCPPLLVPEVAAGAAPELDAARTAASDALAVLAAARADRFVVVGPAGSAAPGPRRPGATGSFRGFGVPVDVVLPTPDASPPPAGELPPSLAVAAWLLGHAGRPLPVSGALAVADDLDPEACLRAGREIAAEAPRTALLVMGDGSACRTLKAPGYLDERAEGFDASVAAALATADIGALAGLDVTLARELGAVGRAPWQLLAGAAEGTGLGGRLLYEDAPYGVGYFVAAWS
ncbi:class III extradiol dioxygenase subunit B-like domain-containing protein [Streptomyces sp. 8L]|uniref:class III extradiol dioxygenase subunit B-like domain-containing protein n=1 Tax=Streptomyces sp. 8L TaxID=2877242 RepID=UPI001CD3402C|nr:class III extradiol dioxygenase subunit B-like domain-containing protein [Streptomyces sp. 8L]MCA1217453.1 class III extradiol dioxygenase subunit B-like domain-containing protein [Streptomyces sp. 8L]